MKGVGVFAVVVVVTAVSVLRQSCERNKKKKKLWNGGEYLKMSVGWSSLRRSWEVSGLRSVW